MLLGTHPVCPSTVAWCSGPRPRLSLWLTLAPFCSKNSQASSEFLFLGGGHTQLGGECSQHPRVPPWVPPHPKDPLGYRGDGLQQGGAVVLGGVDPPGVGAVGQRVGHGGQAPVLGRPVEQSPGVKVGGALCLRGFWGGEGWGFRTRPSRSGHAHPRRGTPILPPPPPPPLPPILC